MRPRKNYLNFWGISSMGRGFGASLYKTNVSMLKTTKQIGKSITYDKKGRIIRKG